MNSWKRLKKDDEVPGKPISLPLYATQGQDSVSALGKVIVLHMSQNTLHPVPRSSLSLLTFTCLAYFVWVFKPFRYKLQMTISSRLRGQTPQQPYRHCRWDHSLYARLASHSPTSANGSAPSSHCDNQKCSHAFLNAHWKSGPNVG